MNHTIAPGQSNKYIQVISVIVGATLMIYTGKIIFGNTSLSKADNAFENNLKCAKFLDQEVEKSRVDPYRSKSEVFYSPKLKTCLSTYTIFNPSFYSYKIEDILSNRFIFSEGGDFTSPGESERIEKVYRAKIEELKN